MKPAKHRRSQQQIIIRLLQRSSKALLQWQQVASKGMMAARFISRSNRTKERESVSGQYHQKDPRLNVTIDHKRISLRGHFKIRK
jgi:hypothetical protein